MSPTAPAPDRLTSKPTWLISRISIYAHRLLSDALADAGARGHHYRLLAALAEFGAASQATLGRHAEMDRSDVVAAVNELAEQGLVTRASDPRDARRNVITITAAGTAHLERLDGVLTNAQDELLAPLSGRERHALIDMLARVLAHHTAQEN